MKIISWNVNGLRSIYRKGFLDWLDKARPDTLCLQEVKAQERDLTPGLIRIPGYHSYFSLALRKKGYSGVAVYSRTRVLKSGRNMGLKRFDQEGRFLKLEYPKFILINLYLPYGGRQKENLDYKLEAYKTLLDYLGRIKNKKVVVAGDFNVAHKEIDLARPEANRNNIMFTPRERAQIDGIIRQGFLDAFRKFHKEGGYYSWWPYFANARARNLGWRIDYTFVSKPLLQNLKDAFILSDVEGSDHCPVGIELSF